MPLKIDPFKFTESIPSGQIRNRVLDVILNLGIPFNRWLGLHIDQLTKDEVLVRLPSRVLSKNHLGSTHACALALLGEYPAGLLLARNFPFEEYRLIISELRVEYHKQGRGELYSTVRAPEKWPEFADGVCFVNLNAEVTDNSGEKIATVHTKFQLKKWDKVRKRH